jgi:hypothetical protein
VLAGAPLSGVAMVQAKLGRAEGVTRFENAIEWPKPLTLRIAQIINRIATRVEVVSRSIRGRAIPSGNKASEKPQEYRHTVNGLTVRKNRCLRYRKLIVEF